MLLNKTMKQDDDLKEFVQKNRLKRVLQVLFASLFVNVLLTIFIVYESQEYGYNVLRLAQYKPAALPLNSELLGVGPETLEAQIVGLKEKAVPDLFLLLEDESPVADGYKVQDLALGLLTSLHHFDLPRALVSLQVGVHLEKQERVLEVGDLRVTLHRHFVGEHFAAISKFVKEERYPFTCQGLFVLQKQDETRTDGELKKAFLQTSEFLTIETIFKRGKEKGVDISSDELVELVLAGDWKTFSDCIQEEKKAQDFSALMRKKLLLTYLGFSSKVAAKLLFLLERETAVHLLTDAEVIKVLAMLEETPALSLDYALTLLESKRGDAVWKAAQDFLVKAEKKEELRAFSRRDLLIHFGKKAPLAEEGKVVAKTNIKTVQKVLPAVKAKATVKSNAKPQVRLNPGSGIAKKEPAAPAKKQVFYTVQQGDNLWKISKKFHVEVAVLKQVNNLHNDALKPGTTLRIPN